MIERRLATALPLLLLLCLVLTSCNTVGPRAVRTARVNYNEAIATSWERQMLLNLVRMRYSQTPLFLELSSISTQYNLATGVEIDPLWERPDRTIRNLGGTVGSGVSGVTGGLDYGRTTAPGSDDEYGHSLSLEYYERPTIVYAPLQGEAYVRQMMSPIPTDVLSLVFGSGWNISAKKETGCGTATIERSLKAAYKS